MKCGESSHENRAFPTGNVIAMAENNEIEKIVSIIYSVVYANEEVTTVTYSVIIFLFSLSDSVPLQIL